ncbi:hypothetical protein ACFWFZ_03790 [Streptomyces sp. NPDC060232]|uniref:hypothetical protein n=1 Tax=Streptomyces sp. NPDC060232 TaxID=3347079 RepID=UPI0036571458
MLTAPTVVGLLAAGAVADLREPWIRIGYAVWGRPLAHCPIALHTDLAANTTKKTPHSASAAKAPGGPSPSG